MNLKELKECVDNAIEYATEREEAIEDIVVSVQIEGSSVDDIEFHYDNNCQVSGCVLLGFKE